MHLGLLGSAKFHLNRQRGGGIVYDFLLVFYRNFVSKPVFQICDFKNAVTLKTGLGIRQGHCKCHHAMERIQLPIGVP